MLNDTDQSLPVAIEDLLKPYPDLLADLRRYVHEAIHSDSITPCIDRVIWTIRDTLSAWLARANSDIKKAIERGDMDLAETHEKRRKALSLAGSDGHGMRDTEFLLKLCPREPPTRRWWNLLR